MPYGITRSLWCSLLSLCLAMCLWTVPSWFLAFALAAQPPPLRSEYYVVKLSANKHNAVCYMLCSMTHKRPSKLLQVWLPVRRWRQQA